MINNSFVSDHRWHGLPTTSCRVPCSREHRWTRIAALAGMRRTAFLGSSYPANTSRPTVLSGNGGCWFLMLLRILPQSWGN